MSIFIVEDMHVNAIVTYMIDERVRYWNEPTREYITVTRSNAEKVGRILMEENVRSYCARYKDAYEDEKNAGATYAYKPFQTPLTPTEVIKACQCLEYQSCETDDWEASLACRILQEVKSNALHDLPDYETCPWEINETSAKRLKHAGSVRTRRRGR